MEKMGFCCQGNENPLLMEWEKAEKDSESEGGRDITQMSAGEWLQRQCIVFVLKQMEQSQKASDETSLQAAPEILRLRGRACWVISKEQSHRHTTAYIWTQQTCKHSVVFKCGHTVVDFYFANILTWCSNYAPTVCFFSYCPLLFSSELTYSFYLKKCDHCKMSPGP